jgi:hypothetical protein
MPALAYAHAYAYAIGYPLAYAYAVAIAIAIANATILPMFSPRGTGGAWTGAEQMPELSCIS